MTEIVAAVVFTALPIAVAWRVLNARRIPAPVWVSDPFVHIREVERLAAMQPLDPEPLVLQVIPMDGAVELRWDVR